MSDWREHGLMITDKKLYQDDIYCIPHPGLKTNIDLDVVMTKSAQKFITPLLVTSLNEKKCYIDLFSIETCSRLPSGWIN